VEHLKKNCGLRRAQCIEMSKKNLVGKEMKKIVVANLIEFFWLNIHYKRLSKVKGTKGTISIHRQEL